MLSCQEYDGQGRAALRERKTGGSACPTAPSLEGGRRASPSRFWGAGMSGWKPIKLGRGLVLFPQLPELDLRAQAQTPADSLTIQTCQEKDAEKLGLRKFNFFMVLGRRSTWGPPRNWEPRSMVTFWSWLNSNNVRNHWHLLIPNTQVFQLSELFQ